MKSLPVPAIQLDMSATGMCFLSSGALWGLTISKGLGRKSNSSDHTPTLFWLSKSCCIFNNNYSSVFNYSHFRLQNWLCNSALILDFTWRHLPLSSVHFWYLQGISSSLTLLVNSTNDSCSSSVAWCACSRYIMTRSRSDIGADDPVVDNRWKEEKWEGDREKERRNEVKKRKAEWGEGLR